jgi:EAL domain-containing protein (putative c-di-GMP-specific phosphodiesterase class I)
MDRIRQAIDQDEFVLHFQPFIDLDTGRTVASEALLRWQHPDEGLLFPGSFLGALETGILIEDVGAWVLNAALATQARWQQVPGFEGHLMSVNVSPRQLGTGRLPQIIAEALERHGVAPASLGIEVLESSLMTSGSLVEEELRAIHDMGVSIAIDDFGTGYSALAYLQDFPVDGVKLDRAFVNRSHTERGAGLVRAIREIAAAIGAIAVAEGIENEAELAAVREAGAHWGQGYLLGRPVPAGEAPSPSQYPLP